MTSNKTIIVLLSSACLALGAVACKQGPTTATEQVQPGTASGINLAAMDKSVKPGDDFFSYANGSWVKNTPIPDDRSSIGGFLIADQKREADTKALFDEILEADHAAGAEHPDGELLVRSGESRDARSGRVKRSGPEAADDQQRKECGH